MIRAVYFDCKLPKASADTLNMESGRIYSQVLVEQYRIYRKEGVWLSPAAQERYNDYLNREMTRLLHAHSIDAAQQGFHKACKTTKANRGAGAHYPHKRKYFRTTIWKNTGIRLEGNTLLLALARGLDPIRVELPENLFRSPKEAYTEMRLVYNKSHRRYEWHLVVDDGIAIQPTTHTNVAAIDLGEVHPAVITDGVGAIVITSKALRSERQYSAKRTATIQQQQSHLKKGSRRWKRLQRRKTRFLAQQARRTRDIEHKVSRAVVDWVTERQVGIVAIGDVRDVADGKRLNTKSQQKISQWSHGRMRTYIGYKAEAAGITVVDNVDEAYTSQTCVCCGNRHKPKGRVYTCPACGSVVHRDVQGAANILSRFLYDKLAQVPAVAPKYRQPYLRIRPRRSPSDTGQVARASENCEVEHA